MSRKLSAGWERNWHLLPSVSVRQRAKNCPTMTKISRVKTLTIDVCVPNLRSLYNFEAMYSEKWPWPIFDCKVGQSVLIGMKLELDLWHYLLDVSTKFHIDISNHVEKAQKSSKNPKCAKIIAKIPKIRMLKKIEFMSKSIQRATYVLNLKNLSWFMGPWLQTRQIWGIW